MKTLPLDWRILVAGAAAVAVIVSSFVFRWFRHPDDPDLAERERRTHLNKVGRIVEGHVIEVREISASPAKDQGSKAPAAQAVNGHRKLICYSYSISGVSYETAQDVTGLEERAGVDGLIAGQPASVKYDPANPSDSILVADDWSGLA